MPFEISIRIGGTTYAVPWYYVGVAVLLLASVIRLLLSRGGRP